MKRNSAFKVVNDQIAQRQQVLKTAKKKYARSKVRKPGPAKKVDRDAIADYLARNPVKSW